jgi:hypothetical protein
MEPTAPAQLIAWAVAGLIALFSLGGCADIANMKALDGSGRPFFDGIGSTDAVPIYIPAPTYRQAAPAPAVYRQPSVTCFRNGNFTYCS